MAVAIGLNFHQVTITGIRHRRPSEIDLIRPFGSGGNRQSLRSERRRERDDRDSPH